MEPAKPAPLVSFVPHTTPATPTAKWSAENKKVLENKAKTLLSGIIKEDSKSLMGMIKTCMPSSQAEASREMGMVVAMSHSNQFGNWLIGLVAERIFKCEQRDWMNYLYGVCYGTVYHVRSNIAPTVTPFVDVFGTALGALTVPATLAFANLVFKKLFPDKDFTMEDLPKLKDLIREVKVGDKVEIWDASGKVKFTDQDLKDIKKDLNKLDVVFKLLLSNPDEFEKLFFIHREDGKIFYLDGVEVPQTKADAKGKVKDSQEVKALKRLHGANPTERSDAIDALVNNIAKHVHGDTLNLLDRLVMRCDDGTYCSIPDGKILTEEQMVELRKVFLQEYNTVRESVLKEGEIKLPFTLDDKI
jgi:hypothetical protein